MARDPANAAAIQAGMLRQARPLLPDMTQRLQRLPLLTHTNAIQLQLHEVCRHARLQAQRSGRAPILVHGAPHGTLNENEAFRASLFEAYGMGIRQVVIEPPAGPSGLGARHSGQVRRLIEQGRPDRLRALLEKSGVAHPAQIRSLVHCAGNVRDARALGFSPTLLDPRDSTGLPGEARTEAMARAVAAAARHGQGVLASVPALRAGDLTLRVASSGAPVHGAAFVADEPEAAICLGHFEETGAGGSPNFSVHRLSNYPLAGPPVGQPSPKAPLAGPGLAPRHPGPLRHAPIGAVR